MSETTIDLTYKSADYLSEGISFTAYRDLVVNTESLVHKHDFIELIYVLSGSASHFIDGTEYKVTKGDLLLIDTDQVHYFRTESSVLQANMILLPDFLSKNLRSDHTALDVFAYFLYNSEYEADDMFRTPLIHFRGNDLIAADSIVNTMCDEIVNKENNYAEIVSNYLNILFYMIIRNVEDSSTHIMHDIRSIIPGIIEYIESNSSEQITLNEIAKKYYYSPSYFSRAFKKNFGVTFSAYLQNVRIQNVIRLMQDSDLSIEEISEKIGYHDKRELYRSFKKVTGTTPSSYRKTKLQ